MAKKNSTSFRCSACAAQFPRWLGRCSECNAWDTLVEEMTTTAQFGFGKSGLSSKVKTSAAQPLSQVSQNEFRSERLNTGIEPFDHLVGGGIVPGSLLLLSGDPGIGKSTLILQIAKGLTTNPKNTVYYVTGEESTEQVAMRAERLGALKENILVLNETNLHAILSLLHEARGTSLVIIDSIQTLFDPDLTSAPGTVSQVRDCAAKLLEFAKTTKTALILVGHVTKEGQVAGPRVLEHLVDVILHLEGDEEQGYRLLRANKNRFGATGELAVFSMGERGLEAVQDPSSFFLQNFSGLTTKPSGVAATISVEGTRPLFLEVQALVTKSYLGMPRRLSLGVDQQRLSTLIAVLEKRGGLHLWDQDIYVSLIGGVRSFETALDLSICAAIASSFLEIPLPPQTVYFGEVSLTGEIRHTLKKEVRAQEAKRLGLVSVVTRSEKMVHIRDFIDKIR